MCVRLHVFPFAVCASGRKSELKSAGVNAICENVLWNASCAGCHRGPKAGDRERGDLSTLQAYHL